MYLENIKNTNRIANHSTIIEVYSYDLPLDKETYIHRIGRCGRFGKKGVSISFIKMTDPYDTKLLSRMKHSYNIDINEIPDNIDTYL